MLKHHKGLKLSELPITESLTCRIEIASSLFLVKIFFLKFFFQVELTLISCELKVCFFFCEIR